MSRRRSSFVRVSDIDLSSDDDRCSVTFASPCAVRSVSSQPEQAVTAAGEVAHVPVMALAEVVLLQENRCKWRASMLTGDAKHAVSEAALRGETIHVADDEAARDEAILL